MTDPTQLDDAPLTAEEILTFGAVVEATAWNTVWLEERRAPIAVAAGRPKLGKVFNDDGVGRAVLIRPCMSRGKRVRGLSPVYTPRMLESTSKVWVGWPMYLDHLVSERSRSVREMGGQVLTPWWQADFVMEDDEEFGYQRGGTLAEIWANETVRKIVGNNPDVLHTSISAWPTGGRPGPVPWNTAKRGMIIEGIRRQPQGSVDFVPRGGAGGRLRLAEGVDPDDRPWPEPEWTEEARALVVSAADASYASPTMADDLRITTSTTPDELREMVERQFPHLAEAFVTQAPAAPAAASAAAPASAAAATTSLTESDVQRMFEQFSAAQAERQLTPEQMQEKFEETLEERLREREEQRDLATAAHELIESAEGVLDSWKGDLKARYSMTPDGAPSALIVTEADLPDSEGRERTPAQVIEARVKADLQTARDRIAEAQGKPRVTGEGDATSANTGDDGKRSKSAGKVAEGEVPFWRQFAVEQGIVESADDALSIHGVEKAEG